MYKHTHATMSNYIGDVDALHHDTGKFLAERASARRVEHWRPHDARNIAGIERGELSTDYLISAAVASVGRAEEAVDRQIHVLEKHREHMTPFMDAQVDEYIAERAESKRKLAALAKSAGGTMRLLGRGQRIGHYY